ncbi:hypothetical protein SAMN02745225_02212, partial [Ferrithrix thermotolerans DSM 19514]
LGKLFDHQLFGVSLGFHGVFLHIYFGGKTHISGGLVSGELLTGLGMRQRVRRAVRSHLVLFGC